jgi:hypothetical protein
LGDDTIQFASRYSSAVSRLAALAGDGFDELSRAHGPDLGRRVGDALDAVEAVHATGTKAVRDWPERSKRVLAQVAAMRERLRRAGVDAELRQLARGLVEAIDPEATGGGK